MTFVADENCRDPMLFPREKNVEEEGTDTEKFYPGTLIGFRYCVSRGISKM